MVDIYYNITGGWQQTCRYWGYGLNGGLITIKAIFYFKLTSAGTAQYLCTPFCKELYNVSTPINLPVNILRWILFTLEIILITSAFAFLLGIFWVRFRIYLFHYVITLF